MQHALSTSLRLKLLALLLVAGATGGFATSKLCGFHGSSLTPVNSLQTQLTVAGQQNAATVTLSLHSPDSAGNARLKIRFDFTGGSFKPTPEKTYIQYYFMAHKEAADQWKSSGKADQCDPAMNGLFFFTRWGANHALTTLPVGSSATWDATSMEVIQPIIADKIPFWNLASESTVCLKGGVLASRVYTKLDNPLDYTSATGACKSNVTRAADNLLSFGFDCQNCPVQPPPFPDVSDGKNYPYTIGYPDRAPRKPPTDYRNGPDIIFPTPARALRPKARSLRLA